MSDKQNARRLAPFGLVLAAIATIAIAAGAQSTPRTDSQRSTADHDALEARVTALEERVTALENATADPSPTASPTGTPTTADPSPTTSPAPTTSPTTTATPSPAPTSTPSSTPSPTTTPTTSPSPTTSPTSQPTATPTDFPGAGNTGVPSGTELTAYTGPLVIRTAGTVISGKRITGCLTIEAGGVVIRDSVISCRPGYAAVAVDDPDYSGAPLLIEDVEITCQDSASNAVGEAHFVLRRVDIHGCENGVDANQDITVEDSFIHDLYNGNDGHADGIQLAKHWSGSAFVCCAKDITVRHNTIYSADSSGALGTSALISNPKGDENILIEGNLLAGGAYTLYCPVDGTGANYRVTGNRFSTVYSPKVGAYGATTGCSDEVASGNVVHETGAPLTLR